MSSEHYQELLKENQENMNKLYKTPVITSIIMLLLALFDLPAGYYTLLRIIVCGTAIYLGFIAKGITKISWVWTLGFIAILFNPFIPIHLDREMWAFIDIIVGFIFFVGIFALSGEKATKSFFKTKAFRIKRELIIFLIIILMGLTIFILGKTVNPYEWPFKRIYRLSELMGENKQPLKTIRKGIPIIMQNGKEVADAKSMSTEDIRLIVKDELRLDSTKMSEEEISKVLNKVLEKYKSSGRFIKLEEQIGVGFKIIGLFLLFFGYPIALLIRFIIWTIKTPKTKSA